MSLTTKLKTINFPFVTSLILFISEGKRHDSAILGESGLLQNLEQHAFSRNGQAMCLYRDPAYPLSVHLQSPFRDVVLTPEMQALNKSMSASRVSVEWNFGAVIGSLRVLDFNLKILLGSVGKMHIVCVILQNAITCLYGNQVSEYYDLDPPTVQEYFS